MSRFKGVDIITKANIYFDGKVTSRTIEFPDGTTRTLGVMLPGEYEFNTGKPELMEIQAGRLSWCPAGDSNWREVEGGGQFNVDGNSSFRLKVTEVTDYICSFIDE
ncbi:MAG: pyrimidine/purine nucleoside phosphorylase [Planctomycetaceae bacterium]|nr:pyrimidine/purine nucleoside phosphorylase [Planctomycetaceae bacterium]